MSVDEVPQDDGDRLAQAFRDQKDAFSKDRFPDLETRLDRLQRLDRMILENREALVEALNADFGCRSRTETLLAEIAGCHGAIHYARKNLRRWMQKRKRKVSFWSLPARAYILPQPLGVVGIMSPWNYALHLTIAPLVSALAAGNRAMLCMSEETPQLCALVSGLIAETFSPDLVTVFQGGQKLSPAFAALPFDHLLFTGSTHVGRLIAAAAAPNLTPVTLELGGKSPAVVAPEFDVEEAAERIVWGKCFNAGQTCIAPDYVFVPRMQRARFVDAALNKFTTSFTGVSDRDYTAIVSERFYRRLQDLVDEARAGGAQILRSEGAEPSEARGVFKYPLTLVLDAPPTCRLMQEEIFGPILPVLTYDTLPEVVDYINAGDRPLSAYCFTRNRATIRQLQRDTVSGSFGVNETLLQYSQEDLAFGGVGASGQGAYHGPEGFDTFSHLKSVFEQRGPGRFTGVKLLHPPYGPRAKAILKRMLP